VYPFNYILIFNCFYRTVHTIPTINYKFKVTQVHPEKGSLLGGTTLTIIGEQLKSDNVTVSVGRHACVVDQSTLANSKLICTIAETAQIHKVTNNGEDGKLEKNNIFTQIRGVNCV